jgi:DNA-binding CsgD family transcriptional regulator
MSTSGTQPQGDRAGQPELTDHELLALRLLAGGLTHTRIAALLTVKPETAGLLLHRAQIKLGARTLPHTVARGYETGLLGAERAAGEPTRHP